MVGHRIPKLLREWPDFDREALERALDAEVVDHEDDAPDDPRGLAAHWSADTRLTNVLGYTYWLRFLRARGELDPNTLPGARATRERLQAYKVELARVSSVSQLSYFRRLRDILNVIDPISDYMYVGSIVRKLQRDANPSRDQRELLVSPSEMFDAATKKMDRALPKAESEITSASDYENGLIIGVMICKALRRKNFIQIALGKNISRNGMNAYEVRFEAIETKARRRICAELSKRLTPYIDRWIGKVRNVLLRGRSSDAMWISKRGSDMSASAFYQRFCNTTLAELGVRINPHFARKIIATGVAIARPDLVRMVDSLLDHSDQVMAYNLADQLSASEAYIASLEVRRSLALRRMESRVRSGGQRRNRSSW
jgi:integrase/recombinase XerD